MAMESLSGSGSCVLGHDIEKRKKLNTTILPRRARRHAELDKLDVDVKLIFM